MKPKIFIDGEHGTTGLQLMARLAGRHDLDVISIPEAERRNRDLREQRLNEADIAILCLPDDAARESVAMIEASNSTRVIDTSTAHRVHPDWAYGFAEMDGAQRRRIAEARFVANPGCYPTGAIALIRPLVQAGILPPGYPVSVNAVSGYSGGGKQLIAQMENASAPDHIDAPHFLYGLTLAHKHVPEMQAHGLLARPPIFAPSVGRFAQGMIVQVPLHVADLEAGASPARVREALVAHYSGQDIVQVASDEASRGLARLDPTALNGTDRMELHVFANEKTGQVNLVAVLDNLGKGASGAALQNMDLMLGG
jgi:N-acetyl-gamma-glutamyl-phosphate reductase